MPVDYASFSAAVLRLDRALAALEPEAAAAGVAPPAGAEWFDLLRNKLLPQLDLPPLLVVAIVGGTNIGKSVIFNHLAGEVASTSSPLAAGTKHPVCLVPPGLDDPALLQRLFEPFVLCSWHSPDDPLLDTSENRLFWRLGPTMPPRLLLLDAPDVDSDLAVNWHRARAIRQAADVLVAVLTQQKYNDAAVKQFFRAAVEADKPIIVLFNQCELEADREYWPRWLATFCQETGARPELVYVVPYDRRAAEELRLPFFAVATTNSPLPTNLRSVPGEGTGPFHDSPLPTNLRSVPGEGQGVRADEGSGFRVQGSEGATQESDAAGHPSSVILHPSAANLRDDLAALNFDAIKIRTFRGALRRVLDPRQGVPAYLESIRTAAGDFSAAAGALSAREMVRVGWPTLPTSILVDEIRTWWDISRQPWSRQIHGFYRTLGAARPGPSGPRGMPSLGRLSIRSAPFSSRNGRP